LILAFRDWISEIDCYIGAYSGIGHCLLAQTIGDLFSIVLQSGAYCGFLAIGSLSPGHIVVRFTFSPSEASFHHVFEKERVLCGLSHKEGSPILFVACDANPKTRVKIPDAMRIKIKGYSPSRRSIAAAAGAS
jgi:hypothetical protein